MAIIKSESQESVCKEYMRLSAEVVRGIDSSEGESRTAINRAYYAVFLTVRDRLFGPDGCRLTKTVRKHIINTFKQQHGWNPQSHEQVIFALSELKPTGVINFITLSQQIGELQEARVHADYNFTEEKLKDIPYETWVEYADHMVALASQLLGETRELQDYKQP